MRMKALGVLGCAAFGTFAFGGTYDYASWTSSDLSTTVGTVNGVGVTVLGPQSFVDGDVNSVNNGYNGINFVSGFVGAAATYTSAQVSNLPTVNDLIGMTGGTGNNGAPNTYTVTFSSAVLNPIFDWVSLGNGGDTVSINYDPSLSVSLLSQGAGWWGGGSGDTWQVGNSIYGTEGDGTVLVHGLVSSITFTAPTYEYWYGFEIGTPSSSTPGPAALAPFAAGLFGLACRRKRS